MHKIKELLDRYKSVILYIIFGVLTTLVNLVSYYFCFNIIGISNVLSTIIAWILAVAFAFITNKLWVFNSKKFDKQTLIHEIVTFLGARIITGILDVIVMYIAVDLLQADATLWKMISNIIVIVLNYIASKLLIFKPRDNR